jgi:hypothetical protein
VYSLRHLNTGDDVGENMNVVHKNITADVVISSLYNLFVTCILYIIVKKKLVQNFICARTSNFILLLRNCKQS